MILVERETELKNIFEGEKILSLDTETTGLDAIKDKIRLLQLATPSEVLVIDVFKVGIEATARFVKPLLEHKEITKIVHNGKFDLKFIKQQLGCDVERIYDTFIASMLLEHGVRRPKGYHALDQVLFRELGKVISKDLQTSDWSGVLSKSQIEYAAADVMELFSLREAQMKRLKAEKLNKVAKLEFDAVLPIAWLELCGFYLDMDDWVRVAEHHLIQANEYAEKIYAELQPVLEQQDLFGQATINLNSHQQVQKSFRALGIPMPDSTREFFLTPLTKDYPIIEWLLEYRGHIKAFGTFGAAYQPFIHPVTGRIHADFFQLGAETGRFTVSNPNLNQIPKDPEHRGCFKAEPGWKLIANDFSQEELRILADFSGDKKFQELFFSDHDFHSATALQMFGTLEKRDKAKNCNFGITYCAGPDKISKMSGMTYEEAEAVIKQYFKTFRGVKRWIDYQKYLGSSEKKVRSASGRIMEYNYEEGNWAQKAGVERNAVNGPIQATGADILKRTLRLFYDNAKKFGNQIKLVNVIHDELIVEAKEDIAEEVSTVLTQSMMTAGGEFVKAVPIKVDSKIMDKWRK